MRLIRSLLATGIAGGLLLAGCGQTKPPPPSPPPVDGAQTNKPPQHPELVQPFDLALRALKAMNETGKEAQFPEAEAHFREFRSHWAQIIGPLTTLDPKLATHIEDGAVELDHEFTKPEAEIRVYELDEETIKLGRLLANAAELLGVEIDESLVQRAPTVDTPFNEEITMEITLADHRIEPNVITVAQHTKVTFLITNRGKEVHEFEVGYYALEEEDIAPGEVREMTLVFMDAGEFEIACHIPGHYEVGMHGKIVVTPAELRQD